MRMPTSIDRRKGAHPIFEYEADPADAARLRFAVEAMASAIDELGAWHHADVGMNDRGRSPATMVSAPP